MIQYPLADLGAASCIELGNQLSEIRNPPQRCPRWILAKQGRRNPPTRRRTSSKLAESGDRLVLSTHQYVGKRRVIEPLFHSAEFCNVAPQTDAGCVAVIFSRSIGGAPDNTVRLCQR